MINRFLQILLITVLFTSCVTKINGTKIADELASSHNFVKKETKACDFFITTYQRVTDNKLPYVIYIEGDGKIVSGDLISRDPTPTKPMLINLAFQDPRANVVYMGRPCQYTPMELNPNCNKDYWTDKRLAEQTIASMNEAINKITKNSKFDLIGFSGGGAAAILIGARNKNVNTILTIAGNLDIAAFTKHHHLNPMKGSLNPMDYTAQVQNIPQLHISGGADRIVPSFIAQNFIEQITTGCAKHQIIKKAEHNNYWDLYWPEILRQKITCTP